MLHDFQKFSAIVVVHGENHGFELAIERFHFSAVVGGSIAGRGAPRLADRPAGDAFDMTLHPPAVENRSEERRVGKECRYRWSMNHDTKKIKKHMTLMNLLI